MREDTNDTCGKIENSLYDEFSWLFADNYKYVKMCKIIENNVLDLDHKIAVLERALKLACECVNTTYAKPFGNDVDYTDYFIDQAEKELKDEKL